MGNQQVSPTPQEIEAYLHMHLEYQDGIDQARDWLSKNAHLTQFRWKYPYLNIFFNITKIVVILGQNQITAIHIGVPIIPKVVLTWYVLTVPTY